MKKQLIREALRQLILSLGIFALLFLVLIPIEIVHSENDLLHWDDPAFVIGIFASIVGTAYVLTIRNPNNYFGFYGGIMMSVLLSVQFWLNGQIDMTILYLCIFTPFMVRSLVSWRKRLLAPVSNEVEEAFVPAFLGKTGFILSQLIALGLLTADYLFVTYCVNHDTLADQILMKTIGGIVIASSFLANFWMIYKKNDTWICWVIFNLSSIIYFAILPQPNIFLIVLNAVMLFINGSAQIAWLRVTPLDNFGWAGDYEYMSRIDDRYRAFKEKQRQKHVHKKEE